MFNISRFFLIIFLSFFYYKTARSSYLHNLQLFFLSTTNFWLQLYLESMIDISHQQSHSLLGRGNKFRKYVGGHNKLGIASRCSVSPEGTSLKRDIHSISRHCKCERPYSTLKEGPKDKFDQTERFGAHNFL